MTRDLTKLSDNAQIVLKKMNALIRVGFPTVMMSELVNSMRNKEKVDMSPDDIINAVSELQVKQIVFCQERVGALGQRYGHYYVKKEYRHFEEARDESA